MCFVYLLRDILYLSGHCSVVNGTVSLCDHGLNSAEIELLVVSERELSQNCCSV